MTSSTGSEDHVVLLLGAYLLGGLPEEAAVRAHLDVCATCKAEHDELASVPAWLSLLCDDHEPPRLTVVGDPDDGPPPGWRPGWPRSPRGLR
jgi:hypothetical protein